MAGRGAHIIVLLCVSSLGLAPVRAQTPAANGNDLAVSLGAVYAAQRDQRASPLSYSGLGPFVELAFTHRAGAALLDVGATVMSARSTSSVTQNNLPYERELATALRVEYYRRIHGGGTSRTAWLLGGAAGAELYATDHHFDDPLQRVGSFGLALLSLGPTVMWEMRVGRGRTLSARVGVPVVGLAWRPYSEFRLLHNVPHRVVTIDDLRAVHGAIEYRQPLGARVDGSLIYRLSALDVRELQPYARMSQTMLARVSVLLGRRHP